jgi:hypothetical protein
MSDTVDVLIPLDVDAARALDDAARRRAVGEYVSALLRDGKLNQILAEAISDAKHEARSTGLTDEVIDAELEGWRRERKA